MSQGIIVNGDDNSLLFSTDTDNLFFQGKATYISSYSDRYVDYVTFSSSFGILYNLPFLVFYEYTINMPESVTTILPFVHNSVGKRVSIVSIAKNTTTQWAILIVATTNPAVSVPNNSPTAFIPTVYVFASYIDAAVNTGNGVNVFDSSGQVKFTTNERPLIIKAFYEGDNPPSNLTNIREAGGNLFYVGNSSNRYAKTITWFSSSNTVPAIAKPAIFYSCSQTCVGRVTDRYIYESTAVFSPSTSQLGLEWACVDISLFSSRPAVQSTANRFFAFIVDGAQYD